MPRQGWGAGSGSPPAVVALTADGGFLFAARELATGASLRLGVVVLLFNDNSLGAIRIEQRVNFGARETDVALHNPDFVRLAEGFGIPARRLPVSDAFEVAVREALSRDGPTLIELSIPTHAPLWLT